MHYDPEREKAYELENKLNHELVTVDMSHYTNQRWYDDMYKYLTLIMTPKDPEPPKKPLTPQGKIKQKARVEQLVKAEFDKRFPELLNRGLGL